MKKNTDNIYRELIKTKPALIISSDGSELDQNAKNILERKLSAYSQICCEIGSGSGEHILLLAAKNPKVLFVGLELRYKRIFRTAEKAETIGLKNILILKHNAKNINSIFSEKSLQGVYINFPDPWSGKRRWEKHKLMTVEFMHNLAKLLTDNGFISYKTDHKQRFLQICDILKNSEDFKISKLTDDLVTSQYYTENIPTEFERLFCSKNLPIHFLFAEKRTVSVP